MQQGPLDKLFGLFPIVMKVALTNAELGSLLPKGELFLQYTRLQSSSLKGNAMGSVGDMVIIPGLSKQHAETLKNFLLEKKSNTTSSRATSPSNPASKVV